MGNVLFGDRRLVARQRPYYQHQSHQSEAEEHIKELFHTELSGGEHSNFRFRAREYLVFLGIQIQGSPEYPGHSLL